MKSRITFSAVKVLDDQGMTTSNILSEAIRYSVDMGARILAMPLTILPVSSQLIDAIDYAVSQGAILIAAAGNSGSEIEDDSLAAQDGVITVGSVDNDGSLSDWSNYGSELDLLAPWDVVSLGNDGEAGTSFSAALVAGIAALVLSENPDMSVDDVFEELIDLTSGLAEEAQEIGGVDLDELLSRQAAISQSQEEFTGYLPEEDPGYNTF